MWTDSVAAGLGRLACFTSHRRFLYQECDPLYIHTSIQRRNALSMRLIWSVWGGGGARVCNLHIVQKPECMCSYSCMCCRGGLCLSWQHGESVTVKVNIHVVNEVKLCFRPCSCFNWTDSRDPLALLRLSLFVWARYQGSLYLDKIMKWVIMTSLLSLKVRF